MRWVSTTRRSCRTSTSTSRSRNPSAAGRCRTSPEKFRGFTPQSDLADAKTGEVIARAGEKITARKARELAESGLKEILVSAEDLAGRFIAEDIVDLETGKIFAEAGDELDAKLLAELKEQKVKEFHVLDIDHVTSAPSSATRSTSTRTPTRRKR